MKENSSIKILLGGLGLSLILFIACLCVTWFIQRSVLSIDQTQVEEVVVKGNPEDPYLVVVNNTAPYGGTPRLEEVEIGNQVLTLDSAAAINLRRLYSAAQAAGIDLYFNEAYIDSETQQELYDEEIATNGEVINFENSAPGTNEHQTGLAVDVSSAATDYMLRPDFASTDTFKWLSDNAPAYGFVVRYPQGKEDVTGVIYEPWHLRYVGTDNAQKMIQSGQALEEYVTPQ